MWQHNYKVYNDDGNNPLFYCRWVSYRQIL
jgi:hemolysin-activating ACP:hemolysin acyltransferase